MIEYEFNEEIELPVNGVLLPGDLAIPKNSTAIVVFAHGSGSSRLSPRNQYIAEKLRKKGYATLLFDLLTAQESHEYFNRFQINLLAKRLIKVTEWVTAEILTANMAIGYFGASTGAAAALIAAAELPDKVLAVVSRGGRPDLAPNALNKVQAAVLLIVGGLDDVVRELNEKAFDEIESISELAIVHDASHLFEEPGKLEEVTDYALGWFGKYLKSEVPL
ncbi:dienelactone hydrolase family protein [Mucilaginibacter sp.]|jgi:dienelactone hydrolase|uniref:dienelactone hydrolase family protein n=1 Tax=Mucilaginibacter sp. TaxID=1882438 RepID=UPI0035646C3C